MNWWEGDATVAVAPQLPEEDEWWKKDALSEDDTPEKVEADYEAQRIPQEEAEARLKALGFTPKEKEWTSGYGVIRPGVVEQAKNTFANFAASAGAGTADAGAALLKVGKDIDDATGGRLSGAIEASTGVKPVELNQAMTEYLRERSEAIPAEQGVDPALAETLPAKFGQGLGSMVPVVVGGPVAGPVAMAGMMGEQGRKDAARHGASELEQDAAFYLNAAVGGISERLLGVPYKGLVSKFEPMANKMGLPTDVFERLVKSALVRAGISGAAREGTQEAIEGTASNIIANSIVGYDPDRGTFEGVPEQAFIGALVGGPVGAGVQIGQRPRAREQQFEEGRSESPSRHVPAPEPPLDAESSRWMGQAEAYRESDNPSLIDSALAREMRNYLSDPDARYRGEPTELDTIDAEIRRLRSSRGILPQEQAGVLLESGRFLRPQPDASGLASTSPLQVGNPRTSPELRPNYHSEVQRPRAETIAPDEERQAQRETEQREREQEEAQRAQDEQQRVLFARQDKYAESGRTSEDLELKPEFRAKVRAPAIKLGDVVVEARNGEHNHADIAQRLGFPKNAVPGFVTHDGEFLIQAKRSIDQRTGQRYALSDNVRQSAQPDTNLERLSALSRFRQAVERDKARADRGLRGPARLQSVHWNQRATSVRVGDTQRGSPPEVALAETLARSSPKPRKLVFFRDLSGGKEQLDGGVLPKDPRYIFINVDAIGDPVYRVVAHELTHAMEHQAPAIYREYEAAVVAEAKSRGKYDENRINRGYSRADLNRELTADFTAEAISNPARLQVVLGNNPTLWQRVLGFFGDMIERIARRLEGLQGKRISPLASESITDLRAAHRAMEQAWQDWHSQRSASSDSRRALIQSDRSTLSRSEVEPEAATIPAKDQRNLGLVAEKTQASQREPSEPSFKRQDDTAEQTPEDAPERSETREQLRKRLIDENIDDLLSGKLTSRDILDMVEQASRATSTKNKVTATERESRGIQPAEEEAKRSFGEVWTEMQARVAADTDEARRFVSGLLLNPRPVSDLENALILQHQITLQNQHETTSAALIRAKSDTDKQTASERLRGVRDELQTLYDLVKDVGAETARGLNARKMLARNDFTLVRMEVDFRAANEGKTLTGKQETEIRALHERIASLEARLSEYDRRSAPRRTTAPFSSTLFSDRARAARDRLRARQMPQGESLRGGDVSFSRQEGSLPLNEYAVIGAELIESGVTDLRTFSQRMVAEFGEDLKPHMQRIYGAAKHTHERFSKEVRAVEGDKKRIRTNMRKLRERMASGDLEPRKRPPPRMDKEKLDLLRDYEKAKGEFTEMLFKARMRNRSSLRKTIDFAGELLNLARAIKTSGDVSAPGRQGKLVLAAHPIISRHAFRAQFASLLSEKRAFRHAKLLTMRENAEKGWYKEAGLEFSDPESNAITKQEEVYQGRLSKYVPGVNAAARAYSAFLNRLRADVFDAMVAGLGDRNTAEVRKVIASNINIQTGRGPLGKYEPSMVLLNKVYFAPKLAISRFQYLAGVPMWKAVASKNPTAMRIVATEYLRTVIGLSAYYTMLMLLQDDDDPMLGIDPTDRATFMTVRVGDTRIDPLGGLKQAASFAAQFLSGKKVTRKGEKKDLRSGKWGQDDIGDVLGSFHRSKLHPAVGSAYSAHKGSDFIGRPTTWTKELISLPMPMSLPTIWELAREHHIYKSMILVVLALIGEGVQTYPDDPKKDKPSLEEATMDFIGLPTPPPRKR